VPLGGTCNQRTITPTQQSEIGEIDRKCCYPTSSTTQSSLASGGGHPSALGDGAEACKATREGHVDDSEQGPLHDDADQTEQVPSSTTFHLLEASNEIGSVNAERHRKPGDVFQRGIALTGFETADVGPVDSRFKSQRLLRKAELQPTTPHTVTEISLSGGASLSRASHPDI
jgi:hypothetical protein